MPERTQSPSSSFEYQRDIIQKSATPPDPAAAEGTDEERMALFRRVRDEIRDRLLPEIQED
jgi:hypothetical protein